MKALTQRSKAANVSIESQIHSQITKLDRTRINYVLLVCDMDSFNAHQPRRKSCFDQHTFDEKREQMEESDESARNKKENRREFSW